MRSLRWFLVTIGVVSLAGAMVYGLGPVRQASAGTPTLFGVSIRQNAGETYAQAVTGREVEYGTLDIIRVFYSGNPGAWTDPKLSVNRAVNVSFKADADTVNSGALDATYRAWFAAAPTNRSIWWTYFHEPEDDIAEGAFTASAYRTAWQRIWRISREPGVAMSNVKSALVLMDYTADGRSGRTWTDYYPGSSYVDLISWDVYQFNEKDATTGNDESMAEHQQRRPTLAITRQAGKPYAISELGYDDPATRPAWLRETASWARDNNAVFIAYFDADGRLGDHRLLDGGSQAAWRSAVTGSLWTGEPLTATTAGPAAPTASTVQWTGRVDPRNGTWHVACASWLTGESFVEDPASARRTVSGNPEDIVCGRGGLPANSAVNVRVKLYDAAGTLRYRSPTIVVRTTA